MKKISIVVGYDEKESVAYHVFCQSVMEKATCPVQFLPLVKNSLYFYNEKHIDGSNDFIYSRFLTPYLCNFEGVALFADGDMVMNADVCQLLDLFDKTKAVQVVKHEYKTKSKIKYLGNKNENYPRKNWSSLILWNCSHPKHKILTPNFISQQSGKFLHRFSWLDDKEIGELPLEWNWLAIEYPNNDKAELIHYTLGTPCFEDYKKTDMADRWIQIKDRVLDGMDK
jgi:lipopolysaccharide biosynthesis glycosyltransferase